MNPTVICIIAVILLLVVGAMVAIAVTVHVMELLFEILMGRWDG